MNLPSSFLLAGYSGYYFYSIVPYILFKLEKIKKNEAFSPCQYTSLSYLVANVLSFFYQLYLQIYNFVNIGVHKGHRAEFIPRSRRLTQMLCE